MRCYNFLYDVIVFLGITSDFFADSSFRGHRKRQDPIGLGSFNLSCINVKYNLRNIYIFATRPTRVTKNIVERRNQY